MKKLVLCFDGTWNMPDGNDKDQDEVGKNAETNVIRLYRSILGDDSVGLNNGSPVQQPRTETLKWYDKGVGTRWYERVRGGVFGFGLSYNVRQGYKFLIDNFDPGDEIYIFGFSRGAYTARSLVGLIRNSGLLKKGFVKKADPDENPVLMEAYQLYLSRDKSADTQLAIDFRDEYSHVNVKIKFLGVWDTVGALGIPLRVANQFNAKHYLFHDVELSSIVENAYHAIAIDEHRENYQPALWNPKEKWNQTMEQVWFVGAHADVGGGYPERILSDLPLYWMHEKAKLQGAGLELDAQQVPKQALGEFLGARETDSFGRFLFGLYARLWLPYYRPVMQTAHGQEAVHETFATKREKDPRYKPKNQGL